MHLTEEAIERLLQGRSGWEERNEAVRHLLARCPECLEIAQTVAGQFGMAFVAGRFRKARQRKGTLKQYAPAFEKLQRFGEEVHERLVNERLVGAGLWASLQKHPHPRRLAIVAADPSMHTWGLYTLLIDAAEEITAVHPKKGIEIARLALAVANELDANVYGEALITDFKAAALATRGNCKRIAEDFVGARADLDMALELLKDGTGDPLERAKVLSLQGSWNSDLGFFEKAEKLLGRALKIYQRAGDDSRVGKILIQQASTIGSLEPEKAILLLDEASEHVNSISEPLLELCMRHNLAWLLNDAGRTQEAIGVLEDSRSLYQQFPGHNFQLRLRWLEGKINRNLDHLKEAAETFERTAEDFLEKGLPQECLLCNLDLAEALYAQGDRNRALRLCTSAVMLLFFNAVK